MNGEPPAPVKHFLERWLEYAVIALVAAVIMHEVRVTVLESRDLPPKWLVEKVDELKEIGERRDSDFKRISERLTRIEATLEQIREK